MRWSLGTALGIVAVLVHVVADFGRDAAHAADWPTRPVTFVVPFAAGGNTDTMARMLAQKLTKTFGSPFVVENKPGASGSIGAGYVAQAAPDGYTFLFGAVQQIAVIPQTQKVSYDPAKDFVPVSIFGDGPFALAVRTSIPPTTLQELVAYAKARPGQLSYATGGPGSLTHLAAAMFAHRAGIDMVPVPYRGGGPVMTGLLSGDVQMYLGSTSELVSFVGDSRVRIIGVSLDKRLDQFPNVPAIAELLPGFNMTSWNGLLAPAKVPPEIVDRLAKATAEAARDPEIVKALTQLGIAPVGNTPAEFAAQIRSDSALFDEAIKAAGLKSN